MSAAAWTVLHLHLDEAVPALPSSPGADGFHVMVWYEGLFLGQHRVPAEALPMPPERVREVLVQAAAPGAWALLGEGAGGAADFEAPAFEAPAFETLAGAEGPLDRLRARYPLPTSAQDEATYSDAYFADLEAGALRSARAVVPYVVERVRPARVVDLGCGTGAWLRAFREEGVDDVLGVDGPWVDRERLHVEPEAFVAADLSEPFRTDRSFDLAVSLEVGEHLPPSSAPVLVASLVRLAPVVLFSAAVPLQGGQHHVNEQWPAYWADLFAAHGYAPLDVLRDAFWDDERVDWWYRQNMLLFADETRLADYPRLAAMRQEVDDPPRALVHPGAYEAAETGRRWLLRREAVLERQVDALGQQLVGLQARAALEPGAIALRSVLRALPGLIWDRFRGGRP